MRHKYLLTVAIPTFSRFNKLTVRINSIISQINNLNDLNGKIQLLVIDNATPNINKKVIQNLRSKGVNYVINSFNIGASANVIKCFEHALGNYLWIVSDDDGIHLNALKLILSDLKKNPDVNLFIYDDNSINLYGAGTDSYIASIKSFSTQISLGNCIYKIDCLNDKINILYHYVSSMCPQFIAGLICVNSNGIFCYRSKSLVTRYKLEGEEIQWPYLSAYQMFNIVTAFPLISISSAIKLRRLIWASLPKIRVMIASICYLREQGGDLKNLLNIYLYILQQAPFYKKLLIILGLPIIILPKRILFYMFIAINKFRSRKIKVSMPY